VESLNGAVNKYRENWKNYIQHITENKIPRQMADYQLLGIRSHEDQ
jgi:hypothetical protein